MKRNRLWIAAPLLALSLFAVPMNEVEAAEQVVTYSEPLFVDVKESQRVVLSDVITEAEAVQQIYIDLKESNATTTFTIAYKEGENIGEKVQKLVDAAKANDEYVYGSGAGYGLVVAAKTKTHATVTLYYSYHLLNSDFNSFDFNQPSDQGAHEKEVALVQQREQEIKNYVQKTAATIFTENMTEFEKVKAAYDYIILNTTYGTTDTPGYGGGHSPYSIVKEGVGVCQAYALLFQLLMDEAGVESKYIVGDRYVGEDENNESVYEGHAWNVVTINGQTYHIDTTHGDPVGEGLSEQYISYQTFLLTEEQIKEHGHIITEERPYVKPTSTKFSGWHEVSEPITLGDFTYYTVLNGTYISEADGKEYGNYEFKRARINDQTGALKSETLTFTDGKVTRTINAQSETVFNNKLFFSNYSDGARLWVIDEFGDYGLKMDLYNGGSKEIPQISKIEVIDDELIAYKHPDNKEVAYRESKETGVTAHDIEQTFAGQSETVNKMNQAKSEAAFQQLMKSLAPYIHIDSNNAQLNVFQTKVKNYRAVQKELINTTPWQKEVPAVQDPMKPWQIELTDGLVETEAKKMYITNIFNEKLTAKITVKDNIVTVTPEKAYDKGGTYYLIIPEGVTSVSGVTLSEAISVPFTYE